MGYSQARRVTVIGPEVNAAAHASESAPRNRDVICLTEKMHEALAINVKPNTVALKTTGAPIFEVLE